MMKGGRAVEIYRPIKNMPISNNTTIMSRKQLLEIIHSWKVMIDRNGKDYPNACLNDLQHSIEFVLQHEGVIDDYE